MKLRRSRCRKDPEAGGPFDSSLDRASHEPADSFRSILDQIIRCFHASYLFDLAG